MWWLVRLAFGKRLTGEMTQMLAIGIWKLLQEIAQRGIAFGKQTLAPGFNAMQGTGFATRVLAIVFERCAQRFKFRVIELTQLFGQELGFAFACDLPGDAANAKNLVAQFFGQRQPRQLCGGTFDQRLRQLEYIQGRAPALAAADFGGFDRSSRIVLF